MGQAMKLWVAMGLSPAVAVDMLQNHLGAAGLVGMIACGAVLALIFLANNSKDTEGGEGEWEEEEEEDRVQLQEDKQRVRMDDLTGSPMRLRSPQCKPRLDYEITDEVEV